MSLLPAFLDTLARIETVVVWGLVATLVLTVGMAVSEGTGLSRLSLPFLTGFLVTGRRRRAAAFGLILYMLGGWVFAFLYGWLFATLGQAGWPLGLAAGFVHGLFLLAAMLPMLPYVHPRLASPYAGPTARRRLEPPGFLGLNYGRMTPITTLGSHAAYGAILGWAFGR